MLFASIIPTPVILRGGRQPVIEGERCNRRQWRMKGAERVAAVDKIEDQRKPEDFIGYRNRALRISIFAKHTFGA